MSVEESIGSHFFAINELLLLVLSYMSPLKATSSSIDTDPLASLACVSRNISEAALDALWRSIHRPAAIIRLLPADAYELVEGASGWDGDTDSRATEYKLRRPLRPSDFTAFDKYAPRIRYVDFSNSSIILGAGCELFPYIKAFRDPILPSLVDFRWEPSVVNGSIGAFHLLSREPSLPSQEFSLLMWSEIEHIAGESDVIARTIDAFNDPALPWLPDVKKLTLRTLHYLPAVRSAILNLSNLEHFSCDLRLDAPVFKSLAALPCLRSVDFRWLPPDTANTISPESQTFRSLEVVRISGTLASIEALLPLISSPGLSSVRLIAKDFQSQSVSPSLLSLLFLPSIPTRAATLAHFTFIGPSRSSVSSLARLELAAFMPLYACFALQTFRIDINTAQLIFDDADVRAMARAWPALVVLSVTPPRASSPGVHLYTLWALATGCPKLQLLALEVNADVSTAFRVEDAGDEMICSRRSMEEFNLHCSPCGDPSLVAGFLNVAFPQLPARVFHAYPPPNRPEDRDKWAEVLAGLVGATHTTYP
ncbi:hypothetical protein B0H15DRAFT_805245 [Mycena belliarum]|uniref:F-box domain-containing protein n=1 Tax=Mycena belliarum TaxID=1033014 RepID=A0AAD6TW57_9AGAR|nr:hypothetical protein B0H15DRAFT_805245 [Mycena belliae]